jgi:hypothetical protein
MFTSTFDSSGSLTIISSLSPGRYFSYRQERHF